MIKAYLIHLGYNMWGDRPIGPEWPHWQAQPYLRCDKSLWDDLLRQMAETGFNMVIIDLGEGVKFSSHPEIAVKNAWSKDKLKRELDKARKLGLEPIPKFNFSACHDVWLGKYSRMISTPQYYGVCRDLIAEAAELFDRPRYFHIGMDEEDVNNQRWMEYCVIRQHDLWWNDLLFYAKEVEKRGARAWIWSDLAWANTDVFVKRMPKSILQSNWYYESSFSTKIPAVRTYLDLEKHGFDQVPAGSNWSKPDNFEKTVKFCSKTISPRRLLGFMQSVWQPTLEVCRDRHEDAIKRTAFFKPVTKASEVL